VHVVRLAVGGHQKRFETFLKTFQKPFDAFSGT
jgi:hypothetical protein